MWLINTKSLRLKNFNGKTIPEYAILSHTWGHHEVTFKDYQTCSKDRTSSIWKKRGYKKIANACDQSHRRQIRWCWVDTCCIDKSNSTELQESINSMFRYYSEAQLCLVHLEDFEYDKDKTVDITDCKWFTRGWCLQELIAPRNLHFFDSNWERISRKCDLIKHLYGITKIDQKVLNGERSLSEVSVACRLSWAANRRTTRVEDQAYCLLGILEINMPMLYGEGANAFQRLQQEVLRAHDDPSIFVWEIKSSTDRYQDMLAPSVDCFAKCGDVQYQSKRISSEVAFSHTSRGIRVTSPNLRLRIRNIPDALDAYWLVLKTLSTNNKETSSLRMTLVKIAPAIYVRLNERFLYAQNARLIWDSLGSDEEIYIISPKSLSDQCKSDPGINPFRVDCGGSIPDLRYTPYQQIEPRSAWDSANSRFFLSRQNSYTGWVKLYSRPDKHRPPTAWFVLAMILQDSEETLKWYLVPSDVWTQLEGCKNSKLLVFEAVADGKTILLGQSGSKQACQVGSLTVSVTVNNDSVKIRC